jgi:Na+-driven multidrug efflux pump
MNSTYILIALIGLRYMIPLGISIAVTALVGNALGAGQAGLARLLARIGLQIEICYALINGSIYTLGFRESWPRVFTDDDAVAAGASAIFPIMYVT